MHSSTFTFVKMVGKGIIIKIPQKDLALALYICFVIYLRGMRIWISNKHEGDHLRRLTGICSEEV